MVTPTMEYLPTDIPRVGSLRERLQHFSSRIDQGEVLLGADSKELANVLHWAARIVHEYEKDKR